MTKKNIIIALITFIVAFGTTFYVIRTYFPKQKVEKTTIQKDTLTKPQQQKTFISLDKKFENLDLKFTRQLETLN